MHKVFLQNDKDKKRRKWISYLRVKIFCFASIFYCLLIQHRGEDINVSTKGTLLLLKQYSTVVKHECPVHKDTNIAEALFLQGNTLNQILHQQQSTERPEKKRRCS